MKRELKQQKSQELKRSKKAKLESDDEHDHESASREITGATPSGQIRPVDVGQEQDHEKPWFAAGNE